jgi:peptide/nickel transport system substrate-binding protein
MKRLILTLALGCSTLGAQRGGELRFSIRSEPKTFDPLLVDDESSETIRYLTGGVLVRINRLTQELEPELASSWKLSAGGREIVFHLRAGIQFSDGAPFTAGDVAWTMRRVLDPAVHSPTGDAFRPVTGRATVDAPAADRVRIAFPAPVAGLARLFDQVAIQSARTGNDAGPVLGPFLVAEHKPGQYVLLKRNPHYWKKDAAGRALPYLDAVRLDIQQNRELEALRFRRGEIHLINTLDPELYERLAAERPASVRDQGPSLDSEQLWFNQAPAAPLPEFKKAWFRSRAFRRAISEAINRSDICRVVYRGRATPAAGPVSPANRFWRHLSAEPAFRPDAALAGLRAEGFSFQDAALRDRQGNPVEFSILTNAGNRSRERMGVMIQQDLRQLGIRVNLLTLDFPSLLERITRTFDYEACLLGMVNADLDPSSQMNVWLSSASNHQWNPSQKSPGTPWEAEIDRLMREQASAVDDSKRKAAFDRVQEIVAEEAPFIYLVNRNSLSAVSPTLRNVAPAVLRPQTYWNIERLALAR